MGATALVGHRGAPYPSRVPHCWVRCWVRVGQVDQCWHLSLCHAKHPCQARAMPGAGWGMVGLHRAWLGLCPLPGVGQCWAGGQAAWLDL